ncbi:MAG: STAS domain-containing protein [Limisphaerales bacterium]
MKYEISEKEGIVVIAPKGKMTAGTDLGKLHDKIEEIVRMGARKMVIDLGEVEWMDSHGLGVLVSAWTSLRKVQGELKLARIPVKIEPLSIRGCFGSSPFGQRFSSVDKALKSLRANS